MVMMFMAESPDRRLIEPAANLVNERLPAELRGPFVRGSGRTRTHKPSRGQCRSGVIASVSEAIQSGLRKRLDCFVAGAPRNDALRGFPYRHTLRSSRRRESSTGSPPS